jgi:hypothetical protein
VSRASVLMPGQARRLLRLRCQLIAMPTNFVPDVSFKSAMICRCHISLVLSKTPLPSDPPVGILLIAEQICSYGFSEPVAFAERRVLRFRILFFRTRRGLSADPKEWPVY